MSTNITPDRRRAIAQAHGINEQYLYQCLTGIRDMSPERAVDLEQKTNGEITRFMVVTKRGSRIWPELTKEAADA